MIPGVHRPCTNVTKRQYRWPVRRGCRSVARTVAGMQLEAYIQEIFQEHRADWSTTVATGVHGDDLIAAGVARVLNALEEAFVAFAGAAPVGEGNGG
jgi:hypothetical protein